MTGLAVKRFTRAAYPSVPRTDVSTPLPPHIQGAERRRSRWGLRLLVVGGLAGAAWLLTGAAAQAADRADEPSGSLLGAVLDGDATAPVTGLLTAAARPLEAVPARQHRHHVVADILDVPRRVLTRPAEAVSEVTRDHTGTTVDAAVGGVDTVLREVAGPLRLTGGPALVPQRILAAATTADAPPGSLVPAVRPDAGDNGVADRPAVAPAVADTDPGASASFAKISKALPVLTPAPAIDAVRVGAVARHLKPAAHRIAHRHRAGRPAVAERAAASEDQPGGDGPAAPLQLHLGDVSGTPTSGSGTRTDGATAAFLPATIANSAMACHLRPIVADVRARRHDAEAPTVSPD